jgi:hypothetical protein
MQRTSLQNRLPIDSDVESCSLAYTLNLLVYMQLLKDMKAKLREAAEERETLHIMDDTKLQWYRNGHKKK